MSRTKKKKAATKRKPTAKRPGSPLLFTAATEAQLRVALCEVTPDDRLLYLERLFLDLEQLSKRKREQSLSAFLKFAAIGFLADAMFHEWAKED